MIAGGKVLDKYGPRWVVFAGGILFGGGMIATGFVSSIAGIYITYGLFTGFGTGMVYSCTISNTVKFFPEKKGLVSGLSTGACGVSSVILAPAAQKLIETVGVMDTFKVLGAAVLIVVCGCSQLLRKAPEQEMTEEKKSAEKRNYSWNEMIRTRDFYFLLILLTFGATAGLMIISQASPIAQDLTGITAGQAALTVSLIALANAGGRILWGLISDKLGNYTVLPVMFLLLAASMFGLLRAGAQSRILFFGAVVLIGFCFGGFMAVFPSITAGRFGIQNNGTNYGIMFCGFAAGGFLGPRFASMFRVSSLGLYSKAFVIAGAMCLVGFILAVIVKKLCGQIEERITVAEDKEAV